MAQLGKKSPNLKILSKIYHDKEFATKESRNPIDSIKKYFNDPKKVEIWLSGAVLFFGIFAIIFGFAYFKNQVKSPFFYSKNNKNISLGATNTSQDLLGLSQKDTDQDGLSDYDELYIYGTSPYLADSDSDGIDDQKEIARGTDPSCPAGQNCFASWATTGSEALVPIKTSPFGSSQISVNQLRETLKQAGMSEEELSQLSDEDIIMAYQQALTGNIDVEGLEPSTVDLPVSRIEDLTPTQIRQLLLEQGVPAENLNQISDQELMELVDETLLEL